MKKTTILISELYPFSLHDKKNSGSVIELSCVEQCNDTTENISHYYINTSIH